MGNKVVVVQYLSVAFSISEQTKNHFTRFLWPTALCGQVVVLYLCLSADTTRIPPVGDCLFVLDDILEESLCFPQRQAPYSPCSFTRVFEVHTQI